MVRKKGFSASLSNKIASIGAKTESRSNGKIHPDAGNGNRVDDTIDIESSF